MGKMFSSFAHQTKHGTVLGECVEAGVKKTVEEYIGGTLGGEEDWNHQHDVVNDELGDRLAAAVLKQSLSEAVDDEPARKVSPRSPSCKKRKIGQGLVAKDAKTVDDMVAEITRATENLLNIVSVEKENKIDEEKVEQIEQVVEKLRTVLEKCKKSRSDDDLFG